MNKVQTLISIRATRLEGSSRMKKKPFSDNEILVNQHFGYHPNSPSQYECIEIAEEWLGEISEIKPALFIVRLSRDP